jgi:hypothetical protein
VEPSREIVSLLSQTAAVLRTSGSEDGKEISGDKTKTTRLEANRPELTGHSTPYAMVSNIHHTSNRGFTRAIHPY